MAPGEHHGKDFGEALALLRSGEKMQRVGWNGKDMWIALQAPMAGAKVNLPFLYMRTAGGGFVPWVASHTDLLAHDWRVVK